MAIALPIAADNRLVGTAFLAGAKDRTVAFVTALHNLSNSSKFQLAAPPHGGIVSVYQEYPILTAPAIDLTLALAEPSLDIAILFGKPDQFPPAPRFVASPNDVKVGDEVLVVGYPFALIGSMLETVHPASITALAKRRISPDVAVPEIVLSAHTHPGSSGSPVVRKSDGLLLGVLRGCLAPPQTLRIGDLPLGTDTSVTYVTLADTIPSLIEDAFSRNAIYEEFI